MKVILCPPEPMSMSALDHMSTLSREVFDRLPTPLVIVESTPRETSSGPDIGALLEADRRYWSNDLLGNKLGDVEDRAFADYAEPRKNRAARRRRK